MLCMFEFDAEMFLSEVRRASDDDATPRERLERWIDWQIGIMVHPKHADRYDGSITSWPPQAEVPDRVNDILRRIREPLVEILHAGLRDGSFPDAEPAEDAVVVGLSSTCSRAPGRQGPGLDGKDARETILRFCLPALGAR